MKPKKIKIFIVSSEVSAAVIGADILRALRLHYGEALEIRGLGFPALEHEGMQAVYNVQVFNRMGLVEVIKGIIPIWKGLRFLKKYILAWQPNLVLSIDAPDLSFRLAKSLKKQGIKWIHVVAPSVWAWRSGRAVTVAQFLDHLLCLLPFEPAYFTCHGLAATYMGHPALALAQNYELHHKDPNLCLILPGSRSGEIEHLLPIFLATVKILHQQYPQMRFVLPALAHIRQVIQTLIKDHPYIQLVSAEDRYVYFAEASFALAASGTVCLELGLMHVQTVLAYKVHPLTAWIGRKLIHTPYASLVNIALKEEVQPEFIQDKCQVSYLVEAMDQLIRLKTKQNYGFSKLADYFRLEQEKTPSHIALEVLKNFIKVP